MPRVFRLEQRCRRCGAASPIEVEAASPEPRVARRRAVLASTLAACVACGKRGPRAFALSALLSLPVALPAAAVSALLAVPFVASSGQVAQLGLGGGLTALAFAAGLRLGQADGMVRR